MNTPNNPTGKVFTRKELELIRDLCVEFDVVAITDEIYQHIIYDGTEHVSLATARRHARAHHHHQRHVENLQRDRMARGLGDCASGADVGDTQGPRLSDRGCGRASAGRRRSGTDASRELLR